VSLAALTSLLQRAPGEVAGDFCHCCLQNYFPILRNGELKRKILKRQILKLISNCLKELGMHEHKKCALEKSAAF